MKYSVGLNKNYSFIETIKEFKEHIYEVYFSWGDFPNGRSNQILSDGYTAWELQQMQINALTELKKENIDLNLLFNANCYGAESQSRAFFDKVGTTVDYVKENFGLKSVTTTSPLIAKFIKNNFEDLEVRASVNMEIGTIQGMKYIADYFDSFYMKRELNRDFNAIEILHNWCENNGKSLYMLANSGCFAHCSGQTFHDNMVSHEAEICEVHNAKDFMPYVCWRALKNKENWPMLLQNTWIRPEDIHHYEDLFDTVKLATRMHSLPGMVIDAYVRRQFFGNTLDLFEPGFGKALMPYIINNAAFPEEWFTRVSSCDKLCHSCGYCKEVLGQVLLNTEG